MVKFWILASSFLVVIGALAYQAKVKEVQIDQNSQCLIDTEIASKYEIKNKNMFLVDTTKLKQQLQNDNKCIQEITVKKKYPFNIVIQVKTHKTVAKIEGANLFLDANGNVFSTSDKNNLPTIFLPQSVDFKDKKTIDNDLVIYALKLAEVLEKTDYNSSTIRFITTADIVIYNSSGMYALFTKNRDINEQIDSLQFILGKAKINAAKIEKIDLRFEKPVIVNKTN